MSLREIDWQISYGPNDDPLHSFYIPALERSVRYDRSAGFFSSSALAVAAAGVAGLIRNGGTMRLLVGAQLSKQDVEAITRGEALDEVVQEKLLTALQQPVDEVMRQRCEVLAWMVAQGTLDIRVVLPTDKYGFPRADAEEYYHPKQGIFTDADGDQISFHGSVNESLTAWQRNYEQFDVFRSWDVSRPYHMQRVHRFEGLWSGSDDGWIAMSIPDAARDALIQYAPSHAPEYDPLDQRHDINIRQHNQAAILQRERIVFRFLKDAPTLLNNQQLGLVTSAIKPWPHQTRVLQRVLEAFPRGTLLCDEVGLGKTIEAGLILRQLLISGMVRRVLLLVPKSVARQWQEELYEKFALDVPLYEGGRFTNYAGQVLTPQNNDTNPWNSFDVLIASSQLAKRVERHQEIIQAAPWDLIMVDEAHHARRKDFKERIYRPNRLLSLLVDPKLKTGSIILMTATPMQVHPLEVWDLLKVLGLGGKWGADDAYFLEFYEQLRIQNPAEVDWNFVFEMVCDCLRYSGEEDNDLQQEGRAKLGPVMWTKISKLPCASDPASTVKSLSSEGKVFARKMARTHTPLRALMLRNTRDLLREYVRQGILQQKVPQRKPQNIWIPMRSDEQELYDRIEDYISNFYNKYESQRKGLGFIMTVYRRRLTSSFYAVQKSLERRHKFLTGNKQEPLFTDEDIEEDDLTNDVLDENHKEVQANLYREEIAYVEDFLHELGTLATHDSKVEQLLIDLNTIFQKHNTVIVFTQYTDTMEYLRDKLRAVYGDKVACYSGRGGEIWNGISWVTVPKEDIKRDFREGESIKVLLCTEAASEGLNLQTCGVLINHDMPWNPMRVEQRIGRIDRIGQIHDIVTIRNYFYADTIEARVYQSLANRIDWFETVVGGLQPILTEVNRTIQELAMTSRDQREMVLAEHVAKLEQQLKTRDDGDVLDVYGTNADVQAPPDFSSPITLSDLENVLVGSRHHGSRFTPHDTITNAYRLRVDDDESVVTFAPHVFDAYPNSVALLTYGNAWLQRLFDETPEPSSVERQGLLRLSVMQPFPMSAYYTLRDGSPQRIEDQQQLHETLVNNKQAKWTDEDEAKAIDAFRNSITRDAQRFSKQQVRSNYGAQASLSDKARKLLVRAALIEIVQAQEIPGVLGNDATAFSDRAITGLARHGFPYTHLLQFLGQTFDSPVVSSPYYYEIANASPESLARSWTEVKKQAESVAQQILDVQANAPSEVSMDILRHYYALE